MNTKAKKTIGLIIIFIIMFCCFLLQSCNAEKNEASDDTLSPVTYQNNTYSHFDRTMLEKETEYPFLPFGYDRCIFRANHDFVTDGEISFMENDKNKNFLYYPSALGTVIYKKDTYEIPTSLNTENFDEIMIVGLSDDAKIITDKAEIKTLTSYFLSVRDKASASDGSDVSLYAVSNNDGGLFLLTNNLDIRSDKSGKLYIDAYAGSFDIPEEISKLLSE